MPQCDALLSAASALDMDRAGRTGASAAALSALKRSRTLANSGSDAASQEVAAAWRAAFASASAEPGRGGTASSARACRTGQTLNPMHDAIECRRSDTSSRTVSSTPASPAKTCVQEDTVQSDLQHFWDASAPPIGTPGRGRRFPGGSMRAAPPGAPAAPRLCPPGATAPPLPAVHPTCICRRK